MIVLLKTGPDPGDVCGTPSGCNKLYDVLSHTSCFTTGTTQTESQMTLLQLTKKEALKLGKGRKVLTAKLSLQSKKKF